MRVRLVLLCAIAAVGCTRSNPAFDDSGGTDGQTDSGPDTVDPDTSDQTSGESCDISGGEEMVITVAPGCPGGDDPQAYDEWLKVVEVDGDTWWGGGCTAANCGGCEFGTLLPMSVTTIPIGDMFEDELDGATLPDEGICVHITARRLEPINPSSCEYDSLAVWRVDENTLPEPILFARDSEIVGLPAIDAASGNMLSTFMPTLYLEDTCPCADYPEACCEGVGPSLFEFDVDLPDHVAVGDSEPITLDGRAFDFWAVDAFSECGEPLRLSWALTTAI